ncbi:hypothetical protein [Shimazuella alba]|uniref:Transposase zinc-ribbon domain-containing protein n=1 Tax=Shimazuella alba TaxID=2690964 RepID=A0A6I4W102_9BACL|nr:hypothetical protein [Shimazuella alba]MXQ55930.1 hypothetical protein [Shimazuella alba]
MAKRLIQFFIREGRSKPSKCRICGSTDLIKADSGKWMCRDCDSQN